MEQTDSQVLKQTKKIINVSNDDDILNTIKRMQDEVEFYEERQRLPSYNEICEVLEYVYGCKLEDKQEAAEMFNKLYTEYTCHPEITIQEYMASLRKKK